MLKYLLLLFLLLLTGCASMRPQLSVDDQRASTYKVLADMTVDVGTPEAPDPQHLGWSGTAWVAERADGHSFLLTAGHVCETRDVYTVETFFGDEQSFPILGVSYKLLSADGTTVEGVSVILDDDDLDLCALAVAGDLGDPLTLADRDPHYGSPATVVGAPQGLLGNGIAPVVPLMFSGRGSLFGGKDGLYFVGLADRGNSGSAIVSGGRVVALLNLGTRRYVRLVSGVPHEVLRSFMNRARHRQLT